MSLNSTSGIRKQDARGVISGVAGNHLGRYLAFNFIRNRWDDIKKTYYSLFKFGLYFYHFLFKIFVAYCPRIQPS